MKAIICSILVLFISVNTESQTRLPKNHSAQSLTCKTCHSCDVPTKKDPCLIPCPRNEMITVYQTAGDAPAVITIRTLEKDYFPVVFSHKMHAQMSQMSGGCAGCHHYNTAVPIRKCKNCHESNRKRDDISKPDLKGALHRQCLECHREWSHSTNCKSCHAQKSDYAGKKNKNILPVLSAKDHPVVPEPTKIVYKTTYDKGKLVTFFHDDHTNKFKLNCTSCHQQENCNRCHDQKKGPLVKQILPGEIMQVYKPKNEQHKPCFNCHKADACINCHLDKPVNKFDHASAAGWELNKFHEKLDCRKCHGQGNRFTKLNNECAGCHTNFTAGKFDHKTTGLQLSENHLAADCTDCHQDKTYSKPVCVNCHDDKNYPKDKPGKMVKISEK